MEWSIITGSTTFLSVLSLRYHLGTYALGHAVSTDLVKWKHLPVALSPDENGEIFSGSAVIDWNNTAGFGKEAMVAIFTHSGSKGQVQSLAYSTDSGRTWTKYEGNPVMPNPQFLTGAIQKSFGTSKPSSG